jgi:hypothetical protein
MLNEKSWVIGNKLVIDWMQAILIKTKYCLIKLAVLDATENGSHIS